MTHRLATCAARPLDDAEGQWVHLLPLGEISGRDGRTFRLDDPEGMVRRTDAYGRGLPLPLDYEHQSETAPDRARGPIPAAGWITALQVRADGVWGRAEWTAQARALVAAKEYRFLSPVFMHDVSGRIMRLKGAGLVHAPNLELTALSRQEIPMDSTAALAAIARIAAALDLPEDAGADEILAALGELKSQNRTAEPDPAKYVPIGAVTDLMRSHRSQSQAMSDRDAEARVTAAMNAGHITPAMKDWAVSLCRQDPAGFDAFVSSSPAPYAHLFEKKTGLHRAILGRGTVDTETAAFCRQLDIDPASLD